MIDAEPSDKSPEQLREELDVMRAELADTVEELAHWVDVPAQVRAKKEDTIARLQATKDQAAHHVQESAEEGAGRSRRQGEPVILRPGAFFRPSAAQHATSDVLRLAGAAGYATVLSYDIDSRDFTDPGAAAIRRGLGCEHAPRSPGYFRRSARLLDDLAAPGLTPVIVSALFR